MRYFEYEDFVEKVCELGFLMPKDKDIKGFPVLEDFVPESQWWTNNPDIDPWLWKDRAATEKRLAYGAFFNGKKGYIAPGFYSVFMDAFRPKVSMEERYEAGKLGLYEWKFWCLLTNEKRPIGTHEYRRMIDTGEKGKNALDAAVIRLQTTFDITIAGNMDMLDKEGHPYNKAVVYDMTDNWIPPMWLSVNPPMSHYEAVESIYKRLIDVSKGLDTAQSEKLFHKSQKLYASYS
ncbi:hypothetical protein SAMN02745136_04931 [Anaerocolumna jejuensis DSM 15929]|uniref:Uncharacterized protein n=1 Tax=Anaerocolumna jejuensis DSM 15929 TaxID=1121322 RepID=A0A1M7AQQ6_9FIRM|nr:hypothetical protein [Anaerocolumna jejuensis]SHL45063.1 hypothetical protein SAMN02745136_04931 [Anaerocolumna jejuensis DSM 15929]